MMRAMQTPIVAPVDRSRLRAELTIDRRVRTIRGLEVYVVDGVECGAVMEEVGRIREIEFRREGGGTGAALDIDRFDTGPVRSLQLVTWDPDAEELVSMYRFIHCSVAAREQPEPLLATEELFEFSETFRRDYLSATIELGRSVVNRSARKALLGLYAVWGGLGALVREYPGLRYLFGKITLFDRYDRTALRSLMRYLTLWFPGTPGLIRAKPHLRVDFNLDDPDLRSLVTGEDREADFELLANYIAQLGEAVPPLVISYSSLTDRMQTFETARNPGFGNVMECAILVPVAEIRPKYAARFIESYEPGSTTAFRAAATAGW